jgi:hypothetical protein
MHRTRGFISSIILTAAFSAPVVIAAAPAGQEVQVKVYDKEHKDYHNWDAHENDAWLRFQDENHWKHHDYAKAEKKQQEAYWNWRHAHPD